MDEYIMFILWMNILCSVMNFNQNVWLCVENTAEA